MKFWITTAALWGFCGRGIHSYGFHFFCKWHTALPFELHKNCVLHCILTEHDFGKNRIYCKCIYLFGNKLYHVWYLQEMDHFTAYTLWIHCVSKDLSLWWHFRGIIKWDVPEMYSHAVGSLIYNTVWVNKVIVVSQLPQRRAALTQNKQKLLIETFSLNALSQTKDVKSSRKVFVWQ